MIEYVYELNLPPADQIFLESFKGFNDDHLADNYQYRTDIEEIIKSNWLNFNNIKWDTLLYFKKDNLIGNIHTDISIELLKNPYTAKLCHPYGINWIWSGDGQFLGEVLIRKMENGIDFESALSSIYGVDLMSDNIELCQERLLCGQEHLRHIVEKNIVCSNALEYNYAFGEVETFGNGLFEFN